MFPGKTTGALILLAVGLSSCSLAGRSVSYEIDYLDSEPLVVVPKVQPFYQKKLSSEPITLSHIRGKFLYNDPSPPNREILPEELVSEFQVYQNAVYLKTVTVVPADYRRSEIQYPLYPVQVTYTYTLKLTAGDRLKLVTLPAGIGTDGLTETSVRVFWTPLERNGLPVAGLPYRAVLSRLGTPEGPVTLTSADLDRTSQTFTDLVPGTDYLVNVYYGDWPGHPGKFPSVTVRTPALPVPVDPADVAALSAARSLLPGSWSGTMTCPWLPPTPVRWTIGTDGTYSAVSLLPNQTSALYYGTDADSPLKVLSLTAAGAARIGGTVTVVFETGSTVTESFSDLTVTDTQLTFSFLHLDQYGPVRFELERL